GASVGVSVGASVGVSVGASVGVSVGAVVIVDLGVSKTGIVFVAFTGCIEEGAGSDDSATRELLEGHISIMKKIMPVTIIAICVSWLFSINLAKLGSFDNG
ncbi:hypothetical protein EYB53_013450, partial [Candidatus Chloroploca sp. M-50]